MNKQDIVKALDWTPEELKELLKKKKQKSNSLLLKLINENNEEGAMFLVFDDVFKDSPTIYEKNTPALLLEVNADMHSDNYAPLMLAIEKSMIKLVKESFLNPKIKHKLNLNRKNNKELYENLARSNSPELYDFLESMTINKSEMLSDTLFTALGFGKLDLIKHLINKKVDNQYQPVNFGRAILGYNSIDTYKEDRWDKLYEYTNFFANIEKNTQNNYIDEESKEIFFSSRLLLKIILKNDIQTLDLYKKIVPELNFKKDIVSVIKGQEEWINEEGITSALEWLFLNSTEIDLTTQSSIRKEIEPNAKLIQFYDKIILNKKYKR